MKRSLSARWRLLPSPISRIHRLGRCQAAPPPPTTSGGCPTNFTILPQRRKRPRGGRLVYHLQEVPQTLRLGAALRGIPGLVGYCVYTGTASTGVTATYDSWKASKPGKSFGFTRPGGESTNIPLNGNTYTVGNATWPTGTVPATQTILLHISGPPRT